MNLFEQYSTRYTDLLNESKSDEIVKMLRQGNLTKAQIAKATTANYSQVHTLAKKLLASGEIGQPPMGKKGRASGGASAPSAKKVPQIKRTPIVAKSAKTARPAGVKSSAKGSPAQQEVDQKIMHMISLFQDSSDSSKGPTYADIVASTVETISGTLKDALTATGSDVRETVVDRLKALVANGEVFQSDKGTFSLELPGEEEEEIGDDELLALKDNDDEDERAQPDWVNDYFSAGRSEYGGGDD